MTRPETTSPPQPSFDEQHTTIRGSSHQLRCRTSPPIDRPSAPPGKRCGSTTPFDAHRQQQRHRFLPFCVVGGCCRRPLLAPAVPLPRYCCCCAPGAAARSERPETRPGPILTSGPWLASEERHGRSSPGKGFTGEVVTSGAHTEIPKRVCCLFLVGCCCCFLLRNEKELPMHWSASSCSTSKRSLPYSSTQWNLLFVYTRCRCVQTRSAGGGAMAVKCGQGGWGVPRAFQAGAESPTPTVFEA